MKNFAQKICLTLTLALLLFTSTCFAKITTDDLCIGGISFGQPISEVIAKYGEPEEKKSEYGTTLYYIFSSPKGKILVHAYEKVYGIHVKEGSRIATKAGIKLGATSDKVESVYGAAKHVWYKNGKQGRIPALFYSTRIPEGDNMRPVEMVFLLDKDKTVKTMWITYIGE
jgi:hypothetical protein